MKWYRLQRAPVLCPFSTPCQIITPLVEIAIWLPNPNPTPNPNPSPTHNPKPANTGGGGGGGNNLAGVRTGHNTGTFVRVFEECSIFYALVWLAPGVEATLERASQTSPVWCGHKDVLHLNKRSPFQEKRDRGSSCEWGGQP